MLGGLLAPLRVPERVLEALDALVASTRELSPMRSELTRVREQTKPLAEMGVMLERMNEELGAKLDGVHGVVVEMESERSHLNLTSIELGAKVGALHDALAPVDERLATIEREVGAIHETLTGYRTTSSACLACGGNAGSPSAPATVSSARTTTTDRPAALLTLALTPGVELRMLTRGP